jgi:hypothetical protein
MSEEKLDEIKTLLEDIKGILQLSNQDKIEEVKKKIIRSGSMEETVYKLCDGEHTTTDIMTTIQKDQKYTNTVLGSLRQKGLIRTIDKDGTKVHEQRL